MTVSMRGILGIAAFGAIVLTQIGAAPKKEPFNVNWYTHPQRLVEVGGRRMNIICAGKGSPTVILDAGLGDGAAAWRLVQYAIARHTRACSYDRAGMGFSDPTTSPRDAAAVVSDLHALLRGARISPPYVLVGHSIAGLYTRLYADRYPNDVVGLVQVDPSSEYEEKRIPTVEPAFPQLVRSRNKQFDECIINVAQGKCAFFPGGLAGYRKGLQAAGCPHVDVDCAVAEVIGEQESRASFWRDEALEAEAVTKTSAEVRSEQRAYGDLPLLVLTESEQGDLEENKADHDPIPPTQQRAAWIVEKQLHDRIAALSSRGANLVIAGSGHYIQYDHPSAVVSAVEKVVDQANPTVHPGRSPRRNAP